MKHLFLASLACLASCCWYPDCPQEEWIEDKIEDYTGLDIDLTSEDGK